MNLKKTLSKTSVLKCLETFHAHSSPANMVNVPKIQRTFWKKCGKHQPCKVNARKARILSVPGESHVMIGSRADVFGTLSPFSRKRPKLTGTFC